MRKAIKVVPCFQAGRGVKRQAVHRCCPPADAGEELRRAETAGLVAIAGNDPATCQIELMHPAVPDYTPALCIALDAWLAAWRVARLPRRERDLAIRQDLTCFRAGLLVLARLDVADDPALPTVARRVRFDEMVAVVHQWFLLVHQGIERGMQTYGTLLAQVRRADVEVEAHLALVGLDLLRHGAAGEPPEEVPW